jgi:hypothetical protein
MHYRPHYNTQPQGHDVVDSTGFTSDDYAPGLYRLTSQVDCYFMQGDNTIAVGDVKVDESTPDVSHPLFARESLFVEVTDPTNDSFAFKTTSSGASGVVTIASYCLRTEL